MTTGATFDDLADRHVLITGGAHGIGRALVHAFVEQRAFVTVLDRDANAGAALATQLNTDADTDEATGRHAPHRVAFHAVDLTDEAALDATLDRVLNDTGPVDVLINNAGWDPRYDLTEMTATQWDDLFALNVRAAFLTARRAIPGMRARGGGSIINVASVCWWVSPQRMACYTATKGAVMGFTKSLANEVGRDGIRVNAVAPGWVMTERQLRDMVTEETKRKLLDEWQALPVLLTPEMIAPTFLFLASRASAPITRQTILVDGGFADS
ncbi:MAG: SDR family oxidoreductase [Phycisphaera sp.]|nr:SDR family oxidoreductase [Phycisphaera sp.]